VLKGNLKLAIVQPSWSVCGSTPLDWQQPSDRTSPSGSATATAIVSAWT